MSGRGRPESTLWRRALSTLLVIGLLVGTAAAFAVTERLKLVRSPITDTHVHVGDHAARGVVVVR